MFYLFDTKYITRCNDKQCGYIDEKCLTIKL